MRARRHLALSLAMLTAAATPVVEARAQGGGDKAVAQVLFDEALKLMKEGRPEAACPKLEKSQKLDPGMGTQYRLAECYEQIGRIASAWALFVEVAEDAKQAGLPPREAQSRKRAEALEPRVPRLTVRVAPAAAEVKGLRVTRDGAPIDEPEWGLRLPVDPGEHAIAAEAPGKKPWEQRVKAEEGGALEVTVPALENEAPKPPPPALSTNTNEGADAGGGLGGQRAAAIAVGSVAAAGVAVGVVFGVMASSQWDDTLTHCQGGDTTKCDADGIELGGDAKRSAVISTIALGAGGAGLAAAVILWLTAPSRAASGGGRAGAARFTVTPALGPAMTGGVARWRF